MTRDEALMQALFAQIEETLGPHVQAVMVFRDTRKRLIWVASPYEPEFTRDLLDYARDNFSGTPTNKPPADA
jgi:hypothetical protein